MANLSFSGMMGLGDPAIMSQYFAQEEQKRKEEEKRKKKEQELSQANQAAQQNQTSQITPQPNNQQTKQTQAKKNNNPTKQKKTQPQSLTQEQKSALEKASDPVKLATQAANTIISYAQQKGRGISNFTPADEALISGSRYGQTQPYYQRKNTSGIQKNMNAKGYTDFKGGKIREDGVVDDAFRQAYTNYRTHVTHQQKPSEEAKKLQEELNAMGFTDMNGEALKADGQWGPKMCIRDSCPAVAYAFCPLFAFPVVSFFW